MFPTNPIHPHKKSYFKFNIDKQLVTNLLHYALISAII
ncbi:hypothetical protein HYN43_009125 [Mucilaginibacter celer]|uniref:Uncharacterized protein n=1 Tax=Mucilaginibacter celer TaxID=2305508 RepID=A0A494VWL4_9SPHI|nr:hypothetical protein HYN43_009125 [Mucilaginibacter celer]